MCNSKFKISKFIKLALQVIFYQVILYFVYLIIIECTNHNASSIFSFKELINCFLVINGWQYWFISVYLILYLLHPFINLLISKLTKQQFLLLLIILFVTITLFPTLLNSLIITQDIVTNILFYIFIYLIGCFIKLYPASFKNNLIAFVGFVISLALNILYEATARYRNHFCLLFLAIFIFILFKNMRIKNNKIINIVSSTTFGIYLFHENTFIKFFLWQDLFDVDAFANNYILPVVMILAVIGIFAIGCMVELIRQFFVEKPLDKLLTKKCNNLYNKIDSHFNIEYKNIPIETDTKIPYLWTMVYAIMIIYFVTKTLTNTLLKNYSLYSLNLILFFLILLIFIVILSIINKKTKSHN